MNILWLFAHPEHRSLNAALRDDGIRALRAAGHEVRQSDLYAMGFKAVLDADDYADSDYADSGRFLVGDAQEDAWRAGEVSPDIAAEHEKLAWADALVVHFPLWWFGPPAILKGWFDRVLVQGLASKVKDADGRTRRYGDGGLAGKRALVVTSVGARAASFGPRGIHGHIDEVLWPLHHGTFFYTGMAPLPPFVVYGADRLTRDAYPPVAAALRERLHGLWTTAPLPYRTERGGDYDDGLELRPELAPGERGLGIHSAQPAHPHPTTTPAPTSPHTRPRVGRCADNSGAPQEAAGRTR
ncbi:NAD(P)H-dependent oxidoreductase [Streptomyces sp. WMMC500]|uniref:NAD(P)H-dependent oxidoreductase n=1 Tax=Streptomyces sp. WMMC500 TaxID=3015154 RepID=UPI00248C5D36|nr:NAD(P)H-dependent oxidoreductase [Streptomyces sp. WMMC500]WBB58647.1 NAD(P)H-dependent oxidoreductase [Streptomyces sp. WMMC500]